MAQLGGALCLPPHTEKNYVPDSNMCLLRGASVLFSCFSEAKHQRNSTLPGDSMLAVCNLLHDLLLFRG